MSKDPPLVEVRGLEKIYAGGSRVAAVRAVDLVVERGEFTALAGPSGSGKSTLLNLIGTLDLPTKGEVLHEGRLVSRLPLPDLADFRLRTLGFVFQSYNLIPVLTAVENVEYPLVLQNIAPRERRRAAQKALSWVGLETYADRRPDLLSGGQQQRVAVARAIVHRPDLVLADEPTANLDSKTGAALLDLMETLNQDHGITFLFSSHDPAVLSRARRVVRLQDGQLNGEDQRGR
ncbi:MAG TPA: macrolide ABC transporter ATP-binding protein [Elusimicrobia bacterium]|nr:MAG: macrolide ABC transporter ATP-binding protein [Elusimicrobia bacterium GWA2_66_18]HAZ08605.1 macrolide ABC transporter ATP-binding protein [Elusimicrobiota bacterium]